VTPKAVWRGLVLAIAITLCRFRFLAVWLRAWSHGTPVTSRQRANWLHSCGRLALSAMGIGYRVEGNVPSGATLIAANHLSYLDILICAAAVPCAFVAKKEIRDWPVFGPLSRHGGTIYVDRESRAHSWHTAEEMAARLDENIPVLFFPEGTSTDGSEVHRFHSALFDPAVDAGLPVVPAAICYEVKGKGHERDLCWFGDETFLPHLLRLLAVESFTAVVRFGEPEIHPDRRTAAYRSHEAVETMRGILKPTLAIQGRSSIRMARIAGDT
jgi:1-acyl-sn-glycerol-3-phosphate acyltransferase